MLPDQPMQPGPNETAISFDVAMIVLAIGGVVAAIIVLKLVWEFWRHRNTREVSDDPDEAGQRFDGESEEPAENS